MRNVGIQSNTHNIAFKRGFLAKKSTQVYVQAQLIKKTIMDTFEKRSERDLYAKGQLNYNPENKLKVLKESAKYVQAQGYSFVQNNIQNLKNIRKMASIASCDFIKGIKKGLAE